MTTNQKLREDVKRCVEAFDRVTEERDLLRDQLARADKEAKFLAVVSFSASIALIAFVTVTTLAK
jgi:hypothetical protein